MAFENPAEAVYLLASSGKLYHTHFNDNDRDWGHDMIVGSVHLWQLMEFLFWLKRLITEAGILWTFTRIERIPRKPLQNA